MSTATQAPFLDVRGVSKSYGSVRVLTDMDLSIRPGEVLGLLGSNGAGKSTLLNIIAGSRSSDSGTLVFRGQEVAAGDFTVATATGWGVACVYQELSLFPNLSIVENFRLKRPDYQVRSRRAGAAAALAAIREVFPDFSVSPRAEVGSLTVAEQQTVEIGFAASRPDISVLILDEPTSALSREGAAQLRQHAIRRAAEGVAVIYVTHKLDEVLEFCDRLVVLRDGKIAWDGVRQEVTREHLLTVLGAKEIESQDSGRDSVEVPAGQPVLEVHGVLRQDQQGEPLTVRPGEVVGLAGLEGAGQRELLRHVYRGGRRGLRVSRSGRMAYVSGDRKREGVFTLWGVTDNILLTGLHTFGRYGYVPRRAVRRIAREWCERLGIVAASQDAPIGSLSGGNQQKALIARGMASGARLLLLDDPTRGVDIHTKRDFYEILRLLRADGRGALLYSTEDREFLECDRVYVMANRAVTRELRGRDITVSEIVRASYLTDPSHDSAANDSAANDSAAEAQRASH